MIRQISVLITTYNCAQYLNASIGSILSQSFNNLELIIIDDGSNDNTGEIVNSFNDPRVKYKLIPHQGRSKALNIGLDMCSYDWIALMDADDISLPERLETQIDFLNNNPDYNVISCWYAVFNSKKVIQILELPVDHSEIVNGLNLHSTLCHPGCIISKKLLNDYRGYRNEPYGVDYDLWLRIKDKALFYNIPEILMLLRSRKDSLHRNPCREKNAILLIQRQYFNNNFNRIDRNNSVKSDNDIEGWREWFYGDKAKARKLWFKEINHSIFDLRILFATIVSFFPTKYFEYIKDMNVKARLHYIFHLNKKRKKRLNTFIQH